MGRTEPTFRNLLDRLQGEWNDYRRGLNPREQRAFDALFQKARAHASASGNVCRVDPLESVFLSMLLEHEMELQTLRAALALRGGAPTEPPQEAFPAAPRHDATDPDPASASVSGASSAAARPFVARRGRVATPLAQTRLANP